MNDDELFVHKMTEQFEQLEGMKVMPLLSTAVGVNVGSLIPVQVFPGLYVIAEFDGVEKEPWEGHWDLSDPLVITHIKNPHERMSLKVKSVPHGQTTLPSIPLDLSWFERRCYAVPLQ